MCGRAQREERLPYDLRMQIFVVGTGRSGTHWVGHILEEHPGVRATIETRPIFPIATRAAIQPKSRPILLPLLRLAYRREVKRSLPLAYADKSHPVIWFAEEVADWFPDARFVAIERNPFATVSSMLLHSGVSGWHANWRRHGIPNEFLGISEKSAPLYDGFSETQKAALRWESHHDRLEFLKKRLAPRLHVLDYEEMSLNFKRTLEGLWEFLDLRRIESSHQPNPRSLNNWRSHLTGEQIIEITEITGRSPG